jgi:glycosyltransferase involved in cell wall biosynthesis
MKTISCNAGYGTGGLGRHLEELVESARDSGELARYYSPRPRDGDPEGVLVLQSRVRRLQQWTPLRLSPGWSSFFSFEMFDRSVARIIDPGSTHVGFSLQSEHTFRAARRRGCGKLFLFSPTCHIDHVWRQYEEAYRAYPIERSWLNGRQRVKALTEYGLADAILVASNYARDSFIEAGFPDAKITRIDASASSRFRPAHQSGSERSETFKVVYIGALSVAKGIPVLLEAFAQLAPQDVELTLVGGCGTRPMRRYLETRLANDPRITVTSGDPLPYLQRADLYVHPSFQDGSPFASLEALACGIPVVVTEDTGTKELIREGINGWVVPTGDVDALLSALRDAYDRRGSGVMA